MCWTIISTLASVASLILFVIYFIGRFCNVFQIKNEIYEKLDRETKEDFKIVDEFDIGEYTSEKVYLTATHTLRNVKIYECSFSQERKKVKKGKLYMKCGSLRNGFTFQFNTYLSECIPTFMLEYQSNDFTKGKLLFAENGKNGIIEEQIYKTHTFRSILFYFFK